MATIELGEDGMFAVDGEPMRTVVVGGDRPADWWKRQNLSVESYRDLHEHIDPSELPVYKLFGACINEAAFTSGARRPAILDVGCGIFRRRSPSFTRLAPACRYVGLDPLAENMERDYSFLCGRLEDVHAHPGFKPRFDVFTFGTSLDHLESLETAAAAIRGLAAPGARMVVWNGLSDPSLLISSNGAAVFRKLVEYPSPALAFAAYAGYGALRLPRVLREMRERRRAIARAEPLDDSHYRWFTEETSERVLSVFGKVVDTMTLPNTHHSIATIQIS